MVALVGLLPLACSLIDPIPRSSCSLDQVSFDLRVTVGATAAVVRARATGKGDLCRLSLPVALGIGVPGQEETIPVGSTSSLRPILQGDLPDQAPVMTWIWSNWCGNEAPPFELSLRGPRGQLLATLRLAAGPPCQQPLRTSELNPVAPTG